MPNNIEEIKQRIREQHESDTKQLDVIFADENRIIVEAPAGFGKTKTMISRLAYLLASGQIPNPKKILGLTFSVNAALKVKREVAEKLPEFLKTTNNPVSVSERITVTNYHGFCKSILKKYGYLITIALRKDINLFKAVDDKPNYNNQLTLPNSIQLTNLEKQILINMSASISNAAVPNIQEIEAYNSVIKDKLLPLDYITHNAIILLVLELFNKKIEVIKFYQNYYPLLIVDEFQDTNCIAWELLKMLITEKTKLLFLGDPLQRIYGFIGALPNIMQTAQIEYNMRAVMLDRNYRFRNNIEMLKLDGNIRQNALNQFNSIFTDEQTANVPYIYGYTQESEAESITLKVKTLIENNANCKIAILSRSRNRNVEITEMELAQNNIPYFFGLFSEEDQQYIDFHIKCQDIFIRKFGAKKNVNRKALESFAEQIGSSYENPDVIVRSLVQLLNAQIKKVAIDYNDLSADDKYLLLLDIFENRQLKQAMEYVDAQVILATVHGAKGLEWDYVLLVDMEKWVFPSFLCFGCDSKNTSTRLCSLPETMTTEFREQVLDELSVFYVGVTRARRQVYIASSGTRYNAQGRNFPSSCSCMLAIKGISLVQETIGTGVDF